MTSRSLPFIEAIRQLRNDLGRGQSVSIHVTLVPYIAAAGELKTKPTQHSVRELAALGVQPDVLVCRCEQPLPASDRAKIALFCNVRKEAVIPALDAKSIYAVPMQYHAEGLDAEVLRAFGIEPEGTPDLSRWSDIVDRLTNPEGEVTVGVVGKYVGLQDAYKSLNEALVHGGIANRVKVNIEWIDAELFEAEDSDVAAKLEPLHAILVPGAFGERGAEARSPACASPVSGKSPISVSASACRWRASRVRATLRALQNASSTEFGPTEEPVVGMITEWMTAAGIEKREEGGDLGGTMRLGAYEAKLDGNSVVSSIYGSTDISERHRHRYEVNTGYPRCARKGGLVFSGMSPDGMLPEIVERPDHPWFVGVQFHPELKSKPFDPHPLFASFIEAAVRSIAPRPASVDPRAREVIDRIISTGSPPPARAGGRCRTADAAGYPRAPSLRVRSDVRRAGEGDRAILTCRKTGGDRAAATESCSGKVKPFDGAGGPDIRAATDTQPEGDPTAAARMQGSNNLKQIGLANH